MATPWPQMAAWPNDAHEHATYLDEHLRKTLAYIDSHEDQPVPKPVVRSMIAATSVLIAKLQKIPDMTTAMAALSAMQIDLKTTANTIQTTAATQNEVAKLSQETHQKVYEAAVLRSWTTELLQETNDIAKAIQSMPSPKPSYASVVSSNATPLSKPITISTQTSSFIQAQREIIVKITDPATIDSLRAKNPRNLQSHVDRAIEQSRHPHIDKIRVASANQLKSGDLSVKTSNKNEADALKEFANDWVPRIGKGTSIRLPTYGILAHGIRTASMDMDKFNEVKAEMLHDNRAFIPNADITYIGWLSRAAHTKSASTIIVEFTRPEDANKIIDEGLIWQGEAFQCERYDRQCRLKQCYKCQRYGHIGTQCRANTACGYCAGAHSSRDCPTKSNKSAERKCAVCKGAHEAWNNRCPARKTELAKVKAAYDARQPYHFVPSRSESSNRGLITLNPTPAESLATAPAATTTSQRRRGRPRGTSTARLASQTPSLPPAQQSSRSMSPSKNRAAKRVHVGSNVEMAQDENEDVTMTGTNTPGSERSRRPHIPSRRALESITTNSILSSQWSTDEL